MVFVGMVSGKLIIQPTDVRSYVGSSEINFSCSTSLTDPVNWEWKRNHSEYNPIYIVGTIVCSISKFNVIQIRRSSTETLYTLVVMNVSLADSGTYKCVDKAGQGPDEWTAELFVDGESKLLLIYLVI